MHNDHQYDVQQKHDTAASPNRNPFSDLSRLVKILFVLAVAAAVAMGILFFLDKK